MASREPARHTSTASWTKFASTTRCCPPVKSRRWRRCRAARWCRQPLLPGHTATFANYTSYSRGLNGVIIDVANMVVLPRIDDFVFTVGNDSNPAGWTRAPTPAYINAYPGRGPGASTQITIIWNDN